MINRIALAVLLSCAVAVPGAALAQTTTPPKPAVAKPAEPAKAAAPAKVTPAKASDDDATASAAEIKACNAKWKTEKEAKKVSGSKAYYTFMAQCL